jgi:Flp pilus assembly protein TadD/tRNA A-37 threonylcarbamoyl transferase component Bud32
MDGRSDTNTHPETVSRFKVLRTLGEGAMGVVFVARDTLLQRDVALKLIKPELAGEEKNRSRFLRECQAAATINHPGVATIYEAGETVDGRLFLASELIEGETLKERVARGALEPAEVVEIGIQLAEALAAAHAKGAIHRDIKPSNIMLRPDGQIKVLDFGLARLVVTDDSVDNEDTRTIDQTMEGAVVGTPAYMSPEQASGMRADERSDIFSAGCVLYELVTGTSPFQSSSVPETLRRVLVEDPPSIESSVDGIPIGLEEVLRGAMAKDRERRTAAAAELAANLKEIRGGSTTTVAAMPAPPDRVTRRNLLVGGMVGLVAVVIAAVMVWQWSRPTLAFTDHDRLLVTDVVNLTGDDAFDLALHTALVTDLKQSPYATVYQAHQVERTLRLMRQPADSFVDEELGRDICRFSAIRAMVVPRIVQVGDAYQLDASIVDPMTGRHVEQIRVTAEGREEVLLDAIDELSHEVRSRLGESIESIDEADFPIADVTTSSWEALHYFALGLQEWGRGKFDEAARLFELAVDLDPEFATCRGSLGLLLIQFLGDPERGRDELQRALADGETLPRDEYLMLRATNRQFVDQDLEGALGEYELITGIYPNYMAAYNNQGRILVQLERYEEAIPRFEKAAELDPKSAIPLVNLAFLFISSAPDAVAAERVSRKLVALDDEVPHYHNLLGWALAVQQRFDEAREAFERTVELEPEHPYAVPNLGYVAMAMGDPESAVLYLRRNLAQLKMKYGPYAGRGASIDLLTAQAAAGDRDGVTRLVGERTDLLNEEKGSDPWILADHAYLSQLNALDGRFGEAEEQLAIARGMEIDGGPTRFEIARACAVLGHRECAIEETRVALETGYGDPYLPMLLPSMNSLLGDPEFMALFPTGQAETGS